MANRHLSYEEFKNIFGDLGITEWTKYNWLDNNFNLPSSLVRVEYVESTGTQWVDLGFKCTQNHRVEILAVNTKPTISGNRLFGSRNQPTSPDAIGLFISTDTVNNITYDYLQVSDWLDDTRVASSEKRLYVVDGSKASAAFETPDNVLIFNGKSNGTATNGYWKVYSAKIFENGNLVRSFIPVFDTEGGTYELYDLITQQIYPSNTELTGPKVFAFTPDNESNIAEFGTFGEYYAFYIELGLSTTALTFKNAATNNDYQLVSNAGNFGYRPQNAGDNGWNINRCYIFFKTNSADVAKELLRNNPVVIYFEKLS